MKKLLFILPLLYYSCTDDIVADIGGAKNIFLKTIQVKTGKFQKKDETNIYLQPDYRINSISELSYLLGIELTEKNH